MSSMFNVLVLLVVLQSSLRLSLWKTHWLRWAFAVGIGAAVYAMLDFAVKLSKPEVAVWLNSTVMLQDVAVVCLIDALLLRLRHYPGMLVVPAACYVLVMCVFGAIGANFQLVGGVVAVGFALLLPLLSLACSWLLPRRSDRAMLHLFVTVGVCILALSLSSFRELPSTLNEHQNIFMQYISQILFGIANMLLIPDVLLLIFFFIRSLVLLVTTCGQYSALRRNGGSMLYTKYRNMLYDHGPDEAYADFMATQFEAEAAKDVNLARLLTKVGPVLGLIGTLISMSPALVGLSNGDISGMAYNMQVVFSATVVGLVISVIGLFTQQLKSRWYAKDLGRLDYVSRLYIERHEKEA